MGQIRQMDEHLATLIAAGEVVTGPASVVRELLDNAVDAGASSVEIVLEEGGLRTIRVADDGCGMDAADALLCLSRHATSKVAAPGDLDAIATLGFRGEALAAVFAVSRLRLESRRAEEEVGTVVTGAGGAIQDVRVVARRPGTTVEVSHLFFNTPGRREYQDTPRAEAGRVLQAVQRAAVANPTLRLTMRDGAREVLALPAARDLLERVQQVFGPEFADALLPLTAVRGEVSVSGFVSHPASGVRRARRNVFAVNGRPFESFEIRRLLSTTFAPILTGSSQVEAILRLHLPRRDVDVNVSPEKSQVRFRRPGQVLATVSDAFRGALGAEEALVRFATEAGAGGALRERWPPAAAGHAAAPGFGAVPSPAASLPGRLAALAQLPLRPRHGLPPHPAALVQLCDSYLLCPVPEGLLIVDQHSAHERVHYERLRERFGRLGRNSEVQSLIFPEPVELDAQRCALVGEMEPFLRRLGFDLTPGGPHTHLVQAVPAALGEHSVRRALLALMEVYAESRELGVRAHEAAEGLTTVEDRMLKTIACHAAVKAGQPLSESEMRALWGALVQVELAGHDVHGRPAVLLLEAGEIGRRMGR